MGEQNQTAQPELRPKRPVYASYGEIIRTLTAEAVERIKQSKEPALAPPKPTVEQRQIAKRLVSLRSEKSRLEAKLRASDLQEDHGRLSWTWSYKNSMDEKPSARRQRRIAKVREFRVRATLDTLDMTPQQAKRYLVDLQRRLAGI